jgi:hypothetical protein
MNQGVLASLELAWHLTRWRDGENLAFTSAGHSDRLASQTEENVMSQHEIDQRSSKRQWVGSFGIAYGLLFGAGYVALGNAPGVKASATTVMSFYNAHQHEHTAGGFLLLFSCLALAFFSGILGNTVFADRRRDRGLVTIAGIGTAVWVSGLLLNIALLTALLDASHDKNANVASTVNYLSNDAFFPVVLGISIAALAIGTGILRNRTLPRWIGWVTIALGVLAAAGPLGGIAFLLAPLWAIVMGVVLILRKSSVAPFSVGELVNA